MVFFSSRTRRSLYQNRARETSFDAFSKALLAACAVDSGGTFPRLRCRKIANLGGFTILWFQNSRGVPLCRTSRDFYSGGGKGPSELRGSPGRCNDEIFRRGMKSSEIERERERDESQSLLVLVYLNERDHLQ